MARLRAAAVEIVHGATVLAARGVARVSGLRYSADGSDRTVECDLVAMAARPEAVISLLAQDGVTPRWDARVGDFVPGALTEGLHAAGHVNGPLPDPLVLTEGVLVGRAAAAAAGFGPHDGTGHWYYDHCRR